MSGGRWLRKRGGSPFFARLGARPPAFARGMASRRPLARWRWRGRDHWPSRRGHNPIDWHTVRLLAVVRVRLVRGTWRGSMSRDMVVPRTTVQTIFVFLNVQSGGLLNLLRYISSSLAIDKYTEHSLSVARSSRYKARAIRTATSFRFLNSAHHTTSRPSNERRRDAHHSNETKFLALCTALRNQWMVCEARQKNHT